MAEEEKILDLQDALNLARQGKEKWNEWAAKHEGWKVDFSKEDFKNKTCGPIYFRGFIFPGEVDFHGAKFGAGTSFSDAKFFGLADFTGAQFGSEFDLGDAKFKHVPDLRLTKIDYHVSLASIDVQFATQESKFPKRAKDPEDADRYRRLKELAVQARDHEQEQNFFAEELRAQRWHRTKWLGLVPNYLYEWLSDFGRSVSTPFLWLGIAWLGFAYAHLTGVKNAWAALLYSAAHLFPFISGARGASTWAEGILYAQGAPSHIHLLNFLEGFLGILFLFLIGLALRNRFRI